MTKRTLKIIVADLDVIHAERLAADKVAKELALRKLP